jgi:hypothetical protein
MLAPTTINEEITGLASWRLVLETPRHEDTTFLKRVYMKNARFWTMDSDWEILL